MIGYRPSPFIKYCWILVTPAIAMVSCAFIKNGVDLIMVVRIAMFLAVRNLRWHAENRLARTGPDWTVGLVLFWGESRPNRTGNFCKYLETGVYLIKFSMKNTTCL